MCSMKIVRVGYAWWMSAPCSSTTRRLWSAGSTLMSSCTARSPNCAAPRSNSRYFRSGQPPPWRIQRPRNRFLRGTLATTFGLASPISPGVAAISEEISVRSAALSSSSASRLSTHWPLHLAMEEFFWRVKPFHSSENARTLGPNCRAISSVRSFEPESTMTNSPAMPSALRMVRSMFSSSLNVMIATESIGAVMILDGIPAPSAAGCSLLVGKPDVLHRNGKRLSHLECQLAREGGEHGRAERLRRTQRHRALRIVGVVPAPVPRHNFAAAKHFHRVAELVGAPQHGAFACHGKRARRLGPVLMLNHHCFYRRPAADFVTNRALLVTTQTCVSRFRQIRQTSAADS